MKNLLLAALIVLSLSASLVPAVAASFHNGSTIADTVTATKRQQTGNYSGG